jgi:hypothetical protein
MVQVRGVTYRVERLQPHHYAIVRLLDDVPMGTFWTLPVLRVSPDGCDVELFAEVARAALRFARTSGAMAAVRPPAPVAARESERPSAMPRSVLA